MPFLTSSSAEARRDEILVDLAALLGATALGDRVAFRRLYDVTSGKLLGIAMLMLRRRDRAEDALQDAFVRIWSSAAQYDPQKGAPLAWLTRIVRNICLDRIKAERAGSEDIADHLDHLSVPPASGIDSIQLSRCIAALNPVQRKVLLLGYLYGYSREEIAIAMEAPVGTVKSWIYRGTESLKSCLES